MLNLRNAYIRSGDNQIMLELEPNQFISYRAAQLLQKKMERNVHTAALNLASRIEPDGYLDHEKIYREWHDQHNGRGVY